MQEPLGPFNLKTIIAASLLAASALAGQDSGDLKQQLTDAATEVSYLSFDQGLPLFQRVAAKAPEASELWQEAVFGEAVCQQQMMPATPGRIAEAARLYTVLVDKCPRGKYTPHAMMALGRIAELVDYLDDKVDLDTARAWYRKTQEVVGSESPLYHEAALRLAGTYIQTFDDAQMKQGLAILEEDATKYPANPLASGMWQYAGNTWFFPLHDDKRAVECYLKADAAGLLDQGREGPLYWRIANLAERNQQRDIAITYFTKIIQKTPTSGKAYESQLALKRLGAPVPRIELFDHARRAASATQPATGNEGEARP